jgi:hypothetical protein
MELPRKFNLGTKAAQRLMDRVDEVIGQKDGKTVKIRPAEGAQMYILENGALLIITPEQEKPERKRQT